MKLGLFAACALSISVAPLASVRGAGGLRAPAFDLPLLRAQGYLRSADLFPAHEHTFLVFWNSECPHCVESLSQCEAFFEERGGDSLAVVGIHTGDGDPFEVEHLLEANRILFPQLWDIGGEVAGAYEVEPATFTLVLVGRDGTVVARRSAPSGDVGDAMGEMIRRVAAAPRREEREPASAAPEEISPSWAQGFVFRGEERLRFLSIDARGKAPVGPYGEELRKGNAFLYRFDFEVSRRMTRHLRVGGLLRIGNEDEKVLEVGPEYLGSRWGSAFAEVLAGGFAARLGHYRISMTPLVLARWDWDDNPRIGGSAGCGCAGAAGVLLVETLEELGPELVFEGGTLAYRARNIEARMFYAIPRRPHQIAYDEYYQNRAAGAEPARYSLETGGGEIAWRKSDPRTGSSWMLGLRALAAWEDDDSVDFLALGYPLAPTSWSSAIVTCDWNVPVWRSLDLRGEWMLFNEAEENREALNQDDVEFHGKGGIAGVVFERAPGWKMRFDYLYLDPDFYSPFAALSYAPNREGARLSAQIPLGSERAVASVFYKRLRETQTPHPLAQKEHESFFGASIDAELSHGLGGTLGWLDAGTWRKPPYRPSDDVRKAFVAGARYRFDKRATLQVQYQRLERTITSRGVETDSAADLYSVYLSTRF